MCHRASYLELALATRNLGEVTPNQVKIKMKIIQNRTKKPWESTEHGFKGRPNATQESRPSSSVRPEAKTSSREAF